MRRLSMLPIAVLCGLSFLAARQALSDFYTHTAALEIAAWARPGFRRDADALPQVIERLKRALAIAPDNAWALEFMGAMQFETIRGSTDPQAAVTAVRDSHASFRRALWQRPTAAPVWSCRRVMGLGSLRCSFRACRRAWAPGIWPARRGAN